MKWPSGHEGRAASHTYQADKNEEYNKCSAEGRRAVNIAITDLNRKHRKVSGKSTIRVRFRVDIKVVRK